jgi:hypothetical protein
LGALDKSLSPARLVPRAEKWNFAEIVYQYAEEMLARMVDLARNAESEVVRLAAQDKILDAAFSESSADKIAGDLRSAGVK